MDATGEAAPVVVVAGNDRLLLQLVGELEALREPTVFVVPPDVAGIARDARALGGVLVAAQGRR